MASVSGAAITTWSAPSSTSASVDTIVTPSIGDGASVRRIPRTSMPNGSGPGGDGLADRAEPDDAEPPAVEGAEVRIGPPVLGRLVDPASRAGCFSKASIMASTHSAIGTALAPRELVMSRSAGSSSNAHVVDARSRRSAPTARLGPAARGGSRPSPAPRPAPRR